ncbi:MAG: hypothetical protein K0U86_18705 [Planctomycetes bacterium]|nr:hypothetical protein [Planctomycetota bacterium]MCH9726939.1 hypothetical protein [Planctomycetota bacterium]MCH9775623.1 hypothetical protein [Planctomycetota bacterium]MCH9789275.1 hypothetical protein [Planctomycetota bacterium]MDF1743431.1 hypothetical protein [Gimesia sp.]
MKSYLKKYLIIFGSVTCYLLLMKAAVYNKHSPHHVISPLEAKVARVHLGSTTTEVDALMGSSPDTISKSQVVIVNSTTMLSVSNEQAEKYGAPQKCDFRTWKRDDVRATVVFDQTGKVVCRWAGSVNVPSYHRYSPYQVFKRVGLF